MKKIFQRSLLAVLMLSFGSYLSAQTVFLTEDFEAGPFPSTWSRTQNANSVGWEHGTNTQVYSQYFQIPAHTKMVATNDDDNDVSGGAQNTATEDRLITPVMDFSAANYVIIEFASFFVAGAGTGFTPSEATIEISEDGGTTWTVVSSVTPTEGEWETKYVDASAAAAGKSAVQFAFKYNDNGEWAYGWALDDVRIFEPEPAEVGLTSVTTLRYVVPGLYDVTGVLRNFGGDPLTAVTVEWTTDGWTTVNSEVLTGLNISPFSFYSFSHSISIDMTTEGVHDLEVRVAKPNGATDPTAADNSINKPLSAIVDKPNRKVLLEEFTGAWCQYCPDGQYRVEQLLLGDTNLIATGVHAGDGMQNTFSATLANSFADGYPSGMVNRARYAGDDAAGISRTAWSGRVTSEKNVITPATVSAVSSYVTATRTATIDLTAVFTADVKGDYRVSLMVIEDKVTGSGSAYDQVNAYNGDASHPYYQAGNPIVGYEHAHVLRTILGGTWGETGVIPTNAVKGTSYTKQYTYTIPGGYDVNNVKFVAVVQFYSAEDENDRQILNAVELGLNDNQTSGTVTLTQTPVVGVAVTSLQQVTCNGESNGAITVSGSGQAPFTFAWGDGASGAVRTNLPAGSYTVTVTDNANATSSSTFQVGEPGALIADATVAANGSNSDVLATVTGGVPPYTYEWSGGETTASLTNVVLGSYTVTVTDGNGCTTSKTVDLTGIRDITSDFGLEAYPNPTSSVVNVIANLNTLSDVTIEVYNVVGEKLQTNNLSAISQLNSTIDLSKFNSGVYFVKLTVDGKHQMTRVVLQK